MKLDIGRSSKRINDLCNPNMSVTYSNVECEVRGNCSVSSPTFIMTRANDYENCNYIYCSKWGRYYFIDDEVVDGNRIYLSCVEDTLASWETEIKDQSLYCVRSTSDFNGKLTDTAFPAECDTQTKNYSFHSCFTDFLKDGSFIIGVIGYSTDFELTNQPVMGATCYYLITQEGLSTLVRDMFAISDNEQEEEEKELLDPISYIVSCYYIPIDILNSEYASYFKEVKHINTGSGFDFEFGDGEAYILASVASNFRDGSAYVARPTIMNFTEDIYNHGTGLNGLFNDDEEKYEYKRHTPYSTYILCGYPIGMVELSDDFVTVFEASTEDHPLNLTTYIDITTGAGQVEIVDEATSIRYFSQNCQIGVPLALAQLTYDAWEMIQDKNAQTYALVKGIATEIGSIGTFAASAASGNVMGMAMSATNAVSGIAGIQYNQNKYNENIIKDSMPSMSTNGVTGGFLQFSISFYWQIKRCYYNINTYESLLGLPCCAIKNIGSLSGFNSFDVAELKTEDGMYHNEVNTIASLLSGGVYIS